MKVLWCKRRERVESKECARSEAPCKGVDQVLIGDRLKQSQQRARYRRCAALTAAIHPRARACVSSQRLGSVEGGVVLKEDAGKEQQGAADHVDRRRRIRVEEALKMAWMT